MKTVFIYALKDPRDGAVRYVGKTETPERRLYLHLREARKGVNQTHKNNWIVSLLHIGLSPEMEILDEVPDAQQNFFERAYIKVCREAGFKLTNGTDGGDGGATTLGRKRPPVECARIGARNLGIPKTSEHRSNISKAKRGSRLSAEHKAAIGAGLRKSARVWIGQKGVKNSFFGHKHSEESIALMRKPKKKRVLNVL